MLFNKIQYTPKAALGYGVHEVYLMEEPTITAGKNPLYPNYTMKFEVDVDGTRTPIRPIKISFNKRVMDELQTEEWINKKAEEHPEIWKVERVLNADRLLTYWTEQGGPIYLVVEENEETPQFPKYSILDPVVEAEEVEEGPISS